MVRTLDEGVKGFKSEIELKARKLTLWGLFRDVVARVVEDFSSESRTLLRYF